MARSKFLKPAKLLKPIKAAAAFMLRIGRAVGARRALFAWSAVSTAVALYYGMSVGAESYASGEAADLTLFLMLQVFGAISIFVKTFVPVFVLIVAMKYIFDFDGKASGAPSETFRASLIAAILAGLAVGAIYYLDAGNIIGSYAGRYCAIGTKCPFSWNILAHAAKAFAIAGAAAFLTLLAARGIYSELSFMLSRKKQ